MVSCGCQVASLCFACLAAKRRARSERSLWGEIVQRATGGHDWHIKEVSKPHVRTGKTTRRRVARKHFSPRVKLECELRVKCSV